MATFSVLHGWRNPLPLVAGWNDEIARLGQILTLGASK